MSFMLNVLTIALPLLPVAFGAAIIYTALKQKRAVDRNYALAREHNRSFEVEVLAHLRHKGLLG